MRLSFVLLALASLSAAACSGNADPECADGVCSESDELTSDTIKLRVEHARVGKAVVSDFLGLSIEFSAARLYMETGGTPNRHFAQLLRNLGDGTLRIGGDSTDSHFRSAQPIGKDEIAATAAVTRDTGWKAYIGVPFLSYPRDPALAESLAKFIASQYEDQKNNLLGVEIGNEPDLLAGPEYPPTYAAFQRAWNGEARGLHQAGMPSWVKVIGPALGIGLGWSKDDGSGVAHLGDFARSTPASAITFHQYSFSGPGLNTCGLEQDAQKHRTGPAHGVATRLSKIECILSRESAVKNRAYFSAAARQVGGKSLVLGETAPALAKGGDYTVGVSDSVGSMLWALDYMFNGLEVGVDRFNFHMLGTDEKPRSAGDGVYNAIAWPDAQGRMTPHPLYYAMLAASHARGGHLGTATKLSGGNANIQHHAVVEADGKHVLVYIINKESGTQGSIAIESAGYASAGAFRVGGQHLTDTGANSVTLDGHVVDPATDTIPTPRFAPLADAGGAFHVDVPVGSAVVVRLAIK